MAAKNGQKQSIYFSVPMLDITRHQADKYGVPMSKIVNDCIRIAAESTGPRPYGTLAFLDKSDIQDLLSKI